MTIVLSVRNQATLTSLLGGLYNPSSPNYRHFLSVHEFTDQFSPTEQDYENVTRWAKSQGFTVVGTSRNRLVLDVSGTAAQVNAALNVSMNVYRDPNKKRTFYSIDREPTLNPSLPIAHIEGLNNFSIPRPMVQFAKTAHPVSDVVGSGPGGSYLGSDMRAAYYGGTLLTGAGQCIGLFEFGGYRLNDVNLTFTNAGQTYSVPINNVLIDGATATPGSNDSEQVLDIVQAIGMAPGLSQVRVYIGVTGKDADIFNSMATENACKQLSVSWSWSPDDPGSDDSIFQEFAAQGQSVFVASGDYGAYDAAVSPYFYPAEDAYVTAVGGTHLTTNYGSAPWVAETAWNTSPYGSGGGISPDGISIPSWQQGISTYSNGASTDLRNVPDVAMEADLDNYYCAMGTCGGGAGGTSFAAPRWAAFMALINQQATEAGTAPVGGLGFINPAIYSIGKGSNYNADLHDITSGSNDSDNQLIWYNAIAGYDLVAGWGSPNGQSLINALAGSLVPGFWLADSPASLSVAQGSTITTAISVTDAGGFAGSVGLSASGLPSGVTASFSPTSTAGTSVLTLAASSSSTVGAATVTITGTSGSLSSKASLFLSVNVPSTLPPPAGTFGSVNIGATSNSIIETLTFTAAGTLSSISVLTQGIANLDFGNAGGGTCAIDTAYASNASCTVKVTFTPKYAGTRYGAVVLADASGNSLAKLFLQGAGVGPQSTFNPGTQASIGSGFIYPEAAAVLGDGSVYLTDYGSSGNGSLYFEKFSNGTYTQSNTTCTLKSPVGVAVDGSGTLYVADPGGPSVYKVTLANGGCTETAIGSGFGTPRGIAVDGSGDVYITDLGTSTIAAAVYKETLQANGTYAQSLVGTGWIQPAAVAVDGNGNIDVADYGIPGVFMETPSGGGYTQTAIGEEWTAPLGIAVDGSGNIYVSEAGNSIVYGGSIPAAVYKEVALGGTYTQTAIGAGWVAPRGIAVDASGNIYLADQTRGVFKNDLADPPALAFESAVAGTISSGSPKTVTVANLGTAVLQFSSVTYAIDFPESPGVSTDCTSSTSLVAGATCTLSIDFLPTTPLGANTSLLLTESVNIATNTLNTTTTQQGLAVTGTEVLPGGSVGLSVSSNPSAAGTQVTFIAIVSGSPGGPTPTGTITLSNGTTTIAGPLSITNGAATYSTNSLSIGTYSIFASYSGDTKYLASNSNTIIESIVPAPGTSNFGNTTIGTQNVGSTSNVIPLTITFSAAETLGSISVLTEGAPNLDFANAGGGTCSIGTTYAANASCTVNVTFTPKYSGTRYGAVVLADNNGNVIGTGYLEGTGVGPQALFVPGTLTSLATGFGYSQGVAIDGSGTLYVADAGSAAVYKETQANGTYSQSSVGSGFSQPYGVAVDGAGNIYVADVGNRAVYKETPTNGSYVQTVIGYGFSWPSGVAVDALGNVYVADFGDGISPGSVYLETFSNGSYAQSTIGNGFISPQSLTVDGTGNVYVADSANGNGTAAVYKLMPSNGSYNQTTIGSEWVTPTGVALDGNGNLYVTDDVYDLGDGFVVKEALQADGTYFESTVLGNMSTPYPGGVAVNGRGDLYVTDNFDGVLYRDDFADPSALSFATTIFGSTSSDSPKTVSVQNGGNATLTFSALGYPADFPEAPGIPSDCTSSTSLGAEVACTLSIDFKPASLSGTNQSTPLSENVTITTNSLNVGGTAQVVAVSGTEAAPVAKAILTVPANTATVGTSVTFTAVVTGQSGVMAPTGSVTFSANGSTLSTLPLSNGAAAYSTNSLAVGTYGVTATYSGDHIYASASSSAIQEQIIPASTFGTQTIGSSSSSKTITITFAKRVTLGSIAVVTQGLPNLDFTNAGGGTCTSGTAYASGASCTVKVAFRPLYPGTRYGAVALGDNKGIPIQTIYLEGTGVGPAINFLPATQTTVGSAQYSLGSFCGMAVDGNGTVYYTYAISNTNAGCLPITKATSINGTYTQSTVSSSTLGGSVSVAVDGAGYVYIADSENNRILKETLVSGAYKESTIGSGLSNPSHITVDGNGNVYVIVSPFTGYQLLKEAPSASGYTETVVSTSAILPYSSIATDGAGNLYISDIEQYGTIGNVHNINRVLKDTPNGSGYIETTLLSNTDGASYYLFAVDSNGNIYFPPLHGKMQKGSPTGSGYELSTVDVGTTLWRSDYSLQGNMGVAGNGDVFIADCCGGPNNYGRVVKLGLSNPPTVSFSSTNVGTTSADSPKLVTIQSVGNAALTLPSPSTGANPSISGNFSLSTPQTTCPTVNASSSPASLSPGSTCIYGINFSPTVNGPNSGSFVLSDNALNAVAGTQTIPLSGTGTASGTGNGVAMAMLTLGTGGVPQGVLVPNGVSPLDSTNYYKVWVDTYNRTIINGYVFLQVNAQGQPTCSVYSQANVTAGPVPQFGTLSYATEYYALQGGACPGILFPFRVARYIWGPRQKVEQDPFVLQVRDIYGQYLNEYGFTAELSRLSVENGCFKGGVTGPIRSSVRTTLTLNNQPAGANSYQWTIDGGNGAIVFANGQQTVNTTTNSATVKYVHVDGGGYQAKLSVKVVAPNGTAPVSNLDYGPFSYISCAAILDGSVPKPPGGAPDIRTTFAPKFGYTLAQAEKVCGYFNFDWQQTITSFPLPSPTNPFVNGQYYVAAISNPTVPLHAPPAFNDPPPSGYVYQLYTDDNSHLPNAVRIPVYYNLYTSGLGLSLDTQETPTTLGFYDGPEDPCLPGGSGIGCNGFAPAGSELAFTTHLVGIQGSLQHPYVCDTGIGFSWTSSYNGGTEGIAVLQSNSAPEPGGTGGITVAAYSDSPPSSSVPTLLDASQISVTISDLETTRAIVTIKNVSDTSIDGPFEIVLDSLTSGVTPGDAAGTFGGWSYVTVPGVESLNVGQAASVTIQLSNPTNQAVKFYPIAYSGEMD